jgi:outer membrane protein
MPRRKGDMMTLNQSTPSTASRAQSVLGAVALAAGLLALSNAAQAQTAGTLMLRGGVTQISPNVDSGDLSPPAFVGTKADIKSDTQLGGGISYMVTDHFAIDLPLATPFKHEIDGAGAIAGVGKIGEVRSLPITLLGQWRFLDAKSPFRPYLGAGLTYAKFYKAQSTAIFSAMTGGTPGNPTTLSVKSKFAATVEVGGTYSFTDHWFLEGFVARTFLKTRTSLSTGQTLDATLDPNTYSLALGYAF